MKKVQYKSQLHFVLVIFIFSYSFTAYAVDDDIKVRLGEQFTLKKGLTAHIEDTRVTLTITGFSYCPPRSSCWVGNNVWYELRMGDIILQRDYPYGVTVGETDYRTFADLIVKDSVSHCRSMKNKMSQNQCWERVAILSEKKTFFDHIDSPGGVASCKMNEARALQVNNGSYYEYVKAVDGSSPDACEKITDAKWARQCYKDIARKTGKGSEICDGLQTESHAVCMNVLLQKKPL